MNTDRFKFRAWYKKPDGKYEMIYDIQASYDNLAGGMGSAYHFNFQDIINDENAVIEQCTGLTDRHNKLIYENDVVNVYIPYEDNHRKCVVQYVIDEGTAQWLAVYLEGKRPHCSMGICYDITSEYLDGSYCTVIGNIHDDQFRDATKKMEDEQC
jgi:uncharacterized phage protein (TIGR01671 family)